MTAHGSAVDARELAPGRQRNGQLPRPRSPAPTLSRHVSRCGPGRESPGDPPPRPYPPARSAAGLIAGREGSNPTYLSLNARRRSGDRLVGKQYRSQRELWRASLLRVGYEFPQIGRGPPIQRANCRRGPGGEERWFSSTDDLRPRVATTRTRPRPRTRDLRDPSIEPDASGVDAPDCAASPLLAPGRSLPRPNGRAASFTRSHLSLPGSE